MNKIYELKLKKKNRERARLENLRILCLEEVRKLQVGLSSLQFYP
jgi:hypothetical protein